MTGQVSRRGFVELLGASGAAVLGGPVRQVETSDVEMFGVLVGPHSARPPPGGEYLQQWDTYRFVYVAEDYGHRSVISHETADWVELPTHLPGFAAADKPADPETGTLYYDENRNIPTWWDTDHYEYPSFVDDVLTTPQTVANTTTQTTVFDPGINEASLVQGRTYQIDLFGTFSTANTSDTFVVDVDLAGTDVAGVSNVGGNVTDAPWSVELTYTVRSHGPTGDVQPHTRALFDTDPDSAHHSSVTVDTTVANSLSVSIEWSAADPGNSATLEQAHLKEMS